jgi:hypothetical protein
MHAILRWNLQRAVLNTHTLLQPVQSGLRILCHLPIVQTRSCLDQNVGRTVCIRGLGNAPGLGRHYMCVCPYFIIIPSALMQACRIFGIA